MSEIRDLTAVMRANSERWFPEIHDPAAELPLLAFYALGLSGETGEAVDEIKKSYRDARNPGALAAELSDVMTYLFLLADEAGIDLVDAYRAKVLVNEVRFG